VEEYDVGFGVSATDLAGTQDLVPQVRVRATRPLPQQRHASSEGFVSGRFEAVGPCTVTFLWDNSYSWMRAKRVQYEIQATVIAGRISSQCVGALARLRSLKVELTQSADDLRDRQLRSAWAQRELVEEERRLEALRAEEEALRVRRRKAEETVASLAASLADAREDESSQRQLYRGAPAPLIHAAGQLYRALGPHLRQRILGFCDMRDIARWASVSRFFPHPQPLPPHAEDAQRAREEALAFWHGLRLPAHARAASLLNRVDLPPATDQTCAEARREFVREAQHICSQR
jgi:hypothetical protein